MEEIFRGYGFKVKFVFLLGYIKTKSFDSSIGCLF